MTAHTQVHGDVAVITLDNPPVRPSRQGWRRPRPIRP